jgi:hypothetical protein
MLGVSSTILGGIEEQLDQFFYLFFEVPLIQNYHYATSIFFLVCCIFFSNLTGLILHPCSFYLSTHKVQENGLETLPVLRMGVQGPFYQDNKNNKQQL